jgi:uncharacterized membrane protein YedE/YeeE
LLDTLGESNTVAIIGLLGGIVLGLAARIGRFCTLGAIEDLIYSSDNRRMRMWGIAIGIAIIATHTSILFDLFDPQETLYLNRVWNPWASIVGGLLFGYGMALVGSCGYGSLARLGGGDLRSLFIVIIMGLSAYLVLSGPFAHLRVLLFPVDSNAVNPQSFTFILKNIFGLEASTIGIILGLVIFLFSLLNRHMLKSPKNIFWGLFVGIAIVSGWLGTYAVAMNGFDAKPVQTYSFVEPIGDTIFYAMTASGNTLSFGVGSVFGVMIGAALGCFQRGQFRWEACEDPRELKRQILGAAIMGPGAILAVGCSVGQGISAFSVLSYSAPITFIAIFCGAALGLKQLITGFK